MSQPESGGPERKLSLAQGLWIAAAAAVVSGFALRMLAGLLVLPLLRWSGVVLIAAGLGLAVLGWISERLSARHAS